MARTALPESDLRPVKLYFPGERMDGALDLVQFRAAYAARRFVQFVVGGKLLWINPGAVTVVEWSEGTE